jgi:hypothetical protein
MRRIAMSEAYYAVPAPAAQTTASIGISTSIGFKEAQK